MERNHAVVYQNKTALKDKFYFKISFTSKKKQQKN